MINLTDNEKLKIRTEVMSKLNRSFDVNNVSEKLPFYKVLLYFLDTFNSGCFYGNINIRIMGPEVKYMKFDDISARLVDEYNF